MAILQPMPLISRNCPAYTNDDFSGSFPASNANNGNYHDVWHCAATPIGNTDSGTLTQPVYLAYDLSGVPAVQRGQVVLIWYNETPGTGAYDASLINNPYFCMARDYTIDVNAAAGGGAAPTSGWVTLATVTGNPYNARQHALNMAGYTWIRINVTGVTGSIFNNNASLDMDVHDAHNGNQDNWIFFGDSISMKGLNHDDSGSYGTIAPAQINALRGAYFLPIWQNASIIGYTAADVMGKISTWLPFFTGRYVAIPLGTNDADGGGALITNFTANMQAIINAVVAAGKIPVIPHIPWGNGAVVTNGPIINGYIDALIAANPTAIAGPDLWTFFQANQSLIDGGIHPTDPAGYAAYRQQWVNWATANIYLNTLSTTARTAYKVRTVLKTTAQTAYKVRTILKTTAQTAFKIQLGSVGHQPYVVSGVTAHSKEEPFSTISTRAIVTNVGGVAQDSMVATVTITYPDNSTASPPVYWLGNGLYSITYETRGVGTLAELWVFTDAQGSQAEYRNLVPCAF